MAPVSRKLSASSKPSMGQGACPATLIRQTRVVLRRAFAFNDDTIMPWIQLAIAGLFEIVWATFLKLSDGFTKPLYSIITLIGMVISFYFLAQAAKVLPLGTAYAIWTGIGAAGAVIIGIFFFREPVTCLRILFFCLLLTGIVGLKYTSGH